MKHKRRMVILGIVILTLIAVPAVTLAFNWSPPVMIYGGPEWWNMNLEAAGGRDGHVYVVWNTYLPGELWFISFDGSQWGAAQIIQGGATWNWYPDIAVGPSGYPHVAWNGRLPGASGNILYTHFDGSSWSSPVGTGISGLPTIAVDNDGQVFIAGSISMGGPIYSGRFDGLTWSALATTGPTGCWPPDLSVDHNNVVHLAYCDPSGTPTFRTWLGTSWSDETQLAGHCRTTQTKIEMFHSDTGESDLLCWISGGYSHWHRDGEGWHGPVEVTTPPTTLGWRPDATGGPNGIILATWTDDSGGSGPNVSGEIYVRVWTGSEWLPTENVSNTPWRSIRPTVGLSSNNQAVAIWSENYNNVDRSWPIAASIAQIEINEPPDCSAVSPSIDSIWPPNHKFVTVDVLGVTDPEGDPIVIMIDSIFQDEPVDLTGDGSFVPDGQGVGSTTAEVRAERDGSGNGRVYHIGFTADDGNGGTCTGEVLVGVPHSQSDKGAPVDDGALYDSTGS